MASTTSDNKVLTLAEVQQLADDKNRCILVINNHVYDVTKFTDEHPGGEEILKEQHGRDASNSFEDAGHSSDARDLMKSFRIAELHPDDAKPPAKVRPLIVDKPGSPKTVGPNNSGSSLLKWLIPLVVVIVAIYYFKFINPNQS